MTTQREAPASRRGGVSGRSMARLVAAAHARAAGRCSDAGHPLVHIRRSMALDSTPNRSNDRVAGSDAILSRVRLGTNSRWNPSLGSRPPCHFSLSGSFVPFAKTTTEQPTTVRPLMGGEIGREYLAAGLVDRLHLHLGPALLGAGVRLFGDSSAPIKLKGPTVTEGNGATHLSYRLRRNRSANASPLASTIP
jgi:hypothetical protein